MILLKVIIPEEELIDNTTHTSHPVGHGRSMDSIPSTFTNGSCSPSSMRLINLILQLHRHNSFSTTIILGLDPDISPDEQEEKARLIAQVLELQNTLDGKFER